MPTTPDHPDTDSAEAQLGSEPEPVAASGSFDASAFDASASDSGSSDSGSSDSGRDGHRETVKLGPEELGGPETVRISRDDRPTVTLPSPRRPVDQAGRAPLIVAAAFATLWAAVLSY